MRRGRREKEMEEQEERKDQDASRMLQHTLPSEPLLASPYKRSFALGKTPPSKMSAPWVCHSD